jgi:hypothetical protein
MIERVRGMIMVDKLRDLWTNVCIMLAAAIACGCAKPSPHAPDYPSREDMRAYTLLAAWGVKSADEECAEVAMDLIKHGNYERAQTEAGLCAGYVHAARVEISASLDEFDDYKPTESYRKIGCHLADTKQAYAYFVQYLGNHSDVSEEVRDGQLVVNTMILKAGDCGR